MTTVCPLCSNNGSSFFRDGKQHFYQCENCKGIFRDPMNFLNPIDEKKRYKHHKNHINDIGYLKFADPIISTVKKQFNSSHQGLDYGAGHTPVISEVLKACHYPVEIFDPLFFDNPDVLSKTYDFITCCEVMEHFYHPKKEFELLFNLLEPNGKLICMTLIYNKDIDFEYWFYKNDPTHVFLYQTETMLWIKGHFRFKSVKIENRLIIFTR